MDNGEKQPEPIKEQEILADRFEMYQIMATVFYRRIPQEEKAEALVEVLELLKGSTDG